MKMFLRRLWRNFCLMLGNQHSLTLYFLPLLQRLWPGFLPGKYRAHLLTKQWQTTDMLQLTFKVSGRWPGFIAGQHLLLTIHHNGRYSSRPFSICSPVSLWQSQRQIQLCCKINHAGEITPLLQQLQSGAVVNISAAQGNFYWQQPATPAVFVAAGSGITPIAAMLLSQRHWLAAVTLYYRVRGTENAALLSELQQLAARQPLFTLALSDSRTEPAETLQQQLCTDSYNKQFYLCGPAAFMQQLRLVLSQSGVKPASIQQEQFGLTMPTASEHASATKQLTASFIRAGISTEVTLSTQHSLLQNAEQQGLAPRFGCRIGVCLQCVCDKVSGQVRDIRSGVLSGHGAEQIQLCVSQPVTALVIKL
ncbi:MAG: iron-sulfur cluster-binding domain-containing protein [Gammaproteobacteria bacterium]|nr:iron-sulfur cluster-binding domain-containing protein [Gammaproteobacteria bacterium]MBU1556112.1 iron-sulfur cluster-binding domain-containing protein [Gammaproteobacteria bacterium]MBU2069748.1 iron-sulfur cluster-binding domain-containing protein [Gammaproteobacteria bacterium]MBU2184613.1 iron-sulfur cluster-binding domain-containing protein [Gammaproteobacteria bacterium]MBU2205721.1 iron-sulfur cluster-binding domain-containing protein [Gammaproteobacteria bacterium]